jgi:signal transduction histidine kinase
MAEGYTPTIEQIAHQIVCLRNISKLLAQSEREVEEVLNTLVHLLPEGWQYSSEACCRVIWEDNTVASHNFEETEWSQKTDIIVGERKIGSLEVYYLEEKPKAEEGPFLIDERNLLDTVAVELGSYLAHKHIERVEKQQRRELELYTSLLRHDLRNDIAVIVGNVEIAKLSHPEMDEETTQLYASTQAVCDRMMTLLNAFGRAAKMAETDIVILIEKIASRAESANSSMKVQVNVDDVLKDMQIAESKLLPLVFDNLLRNSALHAGEAPNVQIDLSREGRYVRIIVSDDGPGVSDEIRKRLFQKGASSRQGGGLGLYLSKQVVETIGGGIKLIESEPGTGATFEILLPAL